MSVEKQYEVLQWAFSFLKKHRREERVAEILLQHHLNMSRTDFFMNMQEVIPTQIRKRLVDDVTKHALTGIPVQHLMGYETFYGRIYYVNRHVLIPRMETEELVEHTIQKVKKEYGNRDITIIDVGTGSGIIAISLALALPHATVYATDISKEALLIAEKNANKHKVSVHFLHGDFIQPIIEKGIQPDVIVSNPPYIRESDRKNLSDTVKNFDPGLALFADYDGLAAYEKIIVQISKLKPLKIRQIFFEIGYDQASVVTELVKSYYPSAHVKTIRDINKKGRIISVQF